MCIFEEKNHLKTNYTVFQFKKKKEIEIKEPDSLLLSSVACQILLTIPTSGRGCEILGLERKKKGIWFRKRNPVHSFLWLTTTVAPCFPLLQYRWSPRLLPAFLSHSVPTFSPFSLRAWPNQILSEENAYGISFGFGFNWAYQNNITQIFNKAKTNKDFRHFWIPIFCLLYWPKTDIAPFLSQKHKKWYGKC